MLINVSAPHASHVSLTFATISWVLIALNYAFLCHYPEKKRLRYAYLAFSGPVALALVPLGVDAFLKALSVQIAGAYFAIYLRAIEFCVLEDPCPSPRSNWQYFLAALRDSYLPFEKGAAAGRASFGQAPAKPPPPPAQLQQQQPQQRRGGGPKHPHLERQPLAAAGSSYPAAVARLLLEVALQYIMYDSLLTLCVKPLSGIAAVSGGGGGAGGAPALFSAASLLASVSFAVCLYLHFAMSNKCIVLALSLALAQPGLLYRCRHLFREPWRGLLSVSELWQRWHQLFRITFVRLAYRPARAGVRRLLSGCRTGAAGANADSDPAAKGDGKAARRGGAGAIMAEGVALFAVFLLSGVIHEYMCWAAFGAARGWQLLFFLSHAAAILVEQAAAAAIARWSVPRGGAPLRPALPGVLRGAMGGASAVFCVLSSVAFMRPWLEAGYYQDIWHPVSPAAWALRRLGGER